MSTRSLTHVVNEDNVTVVTMYRQNDGYPTAHGSQLARVVDKEIVNGFSGDMDAKYHANGMACLAAQVVSAFKSELGGIYLLPPDMDNVAEEYVYIISAPTSATKGKPAITVRDGNGRTLFHGAPMMLWEKAETVEAI